MYGVYWEYTFPYDNTITGFLFIPEYTKKTGTKSGSPEAVPATLMFRTVSDTNPQKTYRFHSKTPTNAAISGTWADPTVLAVQMLRQLDIFGDPQIQSVEGNTDFKMEKDPIFLEITQQELDTVLDQTVPKALTARLYRARIAAGYPALPGKES